VREVRIAAAVVRAGRLGDCGGDLSLDRAVVRLSWSRAAGP
jgi:hypothetical protein